MNAKDQLREYAALMGHEKAQRQAVLAAEHFPCCGAKRAKGKHEPFCRQGNRG